MDRLPLLILTGHQDGPRFRPLQVQLLFPDLPQRLVQVRRFDDINKTAAVVVQFPAVLQPFPVAVQPVQDRSQIRLTPLRPDGTVDGEMEHRLTVFRFRKCSRRHRFQLRDVQIPIRGDLTQPEKRRLFNVIFHGNDLLDHPGRDRPDIAHPAAV